MVNNKPIHEDAMGLAEVGIILYVLLWIIALVDIMRSKFIKRRYELMWLLVIFLVPFGVIVYFAFGKKHKTRKNAANILR